MWRNIKVEFSERINPIGDNKAKDLLAYYQAKEWVQKGEDKNYVYTLNKI